MMKARKKRIYPSSTLPTATINWIVKEERFLFTDYNPTPRKGSRLTSGICLRIHPMHIICIICGPTSHPSTVCAKQKVTPSSSLHFLSRGSPFSLLPFVVPTIRFSPSFAPCKQDSQQKSWPFFQLRSKFLNEHAMSQRKQGMQRKGNVFIMMVYQTPGTNQYHII